MGRREKWFYAVKKAIICESKDKKTEKKSRGSGRCFGKQRSIGLDSANAVVAPASHSTMEEEVKLIEAENEQNRPAYSVALVTAMAAEAAVAAAHAAAEVVRLRAAACNSGESKEEIAAIKIQTAFRGYMARRALRPLRGLVRLKSFLGGQSVKRQAAATLKCMQVLARVQSEVRARRIATLEGNTAIQRQIQQKHEMELGKLRVTNGEKWDDSIRSKEQIEANLRNRREAAIRRERALAYAYSYQQTWRNSSNSANQTFMDPNNPRWGWSRLEQWMAARPWENGWTAADKELNNELVSAKSSVHSTAAKSQSQPPCWQSPSKGTAGRDEDSRSMNSTPSGQCPKHSIAGSSVRDDESLASPSYMASTESARARSRLPSPIGQEKLVSARKRLSFSGSPAGGGGHRRHSVRANIDVSPASE